MTEDHTNLTPEERAKAEAFRIAQAAEIAERTTATDRLKRSICLLEEAVDKTCVAYNKAANSGADMTATETALDAAGAIGWTSEGVLLTEAASLMLSEAPRLTEPLLVMAKRVEAATIAYRAVTKSANAAAAAARSK
jgi:hypothetical protein